MKVFISSTYKDLTDYRAVENFTYLRHPQLQSTQETLAEIEASLKDK